MAKESGPEQPNPEHELQINRAAFIDMANSFIDKCAAEYRFYLRGQSQTQINRRALVQKLIGDLKAEMSAMQAGEKQYSADDIMQLNRRVVLAEMALQSLARKGKKSKK